jgi:fibrillarin-like rRNA methylase
MAAAGGEIGEEENRNNRQLKITGEKAINENGINIEKQQWRKWRKSKKKKKA